MATSSVTLDRAQGHRLAQGHHGCRIAPSACQYVGPAHALSAAILSSSSTMTKHTILFLAANPTGTSEAALGEEARAIHAELERPCGGR